LLTEWHIDLSDVPWVLLNVGSEISFVNHCKLLSWHRLCRWVPLHPRLTRHTYHSPDAAGL